MKPRILAAVMLLMLCFSATANADQWWGPFTAQGFGATEAIAAEGAVYTMDGYAEVWAENNPNGQEVVVVVGDTNWDLPLYEITFWIVTIEMP